MNRSKKDITKIRAWNFVEEKISKEVLWLRSTIPVFSVNSQGLSHCGSCALRKLAMLIVFGGVVTKEIKRDPGLNSFWKPRKYLYKSKVHHGKEWHRATMKLIEAHFLTRGFKVIREPNTQAGRADLGVYKNGVPDLLIEVGTMSSYSKLFIDIMHLSKKAKYLIVPSDDTLVEFTNIKAAELINPNKLFQ